MREGPKSIYKVKKYKKMKKLKSEKKKNVSFDVIKNSSAILNKNAASQ